MCLKTVKCANRSLIGECQLDLSKIWEYLENLKNLFLENPKCLYTFCRKTMHNCPFSYFFGLYITTITVERPYWLFHWTQTSFFNVFRFIFLSTLIIWKMSFDDVKKTRWFKVKIKNDWNFFEPVLILGCNGTSLSKRTS